MKSETANFFKVHNGLPAFARITVKCAESEGIQLVLSRNRDGAVDEKSHPDWVEAAVRGARRTVGELHMKGIGVVITEIFGSNVDTRPDAVYCAAGIPTWRLYKGDAEGEPDVIYESEWKLNYSATWAGER